MENVVRAWSPPPERPAPAGSKKSKDRPARKGELSASVVWRSNAQLGAYRSKFLMDDHDAKMRNRLNNVKPTISTSLDPAINRTRRRGAKRRKNRVITQALGLGEAPSANAHDATGSRSSSPRRPSRAGTREGTSSSEDGGG